MTNQPPLNPDALEAGAKALFMRERKYHTPSIECPEPPNWEDLTETSMEHYRGNARAVLAVAQPEVNSVEELDALPINSVILDRFDYLHHKYAKSMPDFKNLVTGGHITRLEFYLPARVLHRPEVNDA